MQFEPTTCFVIDQCNEISTSKGTSQLDLSDQKEDLDPPNLLPVQFRDHWIAIPKDFRNQELKDYFSFSGEGRQSREDS